MVKFCSRVGSRRYRLKYEYRRPTICAVQSRLSLCSSEENECLFDGQRELNRGVKAICGSKCWRPGSLGSYKLSRYGNGNVKKILNMLYCYAINLYVKEPCKMVSHKNSKDKLKNVWTPYPPLYHFEIYANRRPLPNLSRYVILSN